MIDRPSDMLTLTLPDGATREVARGTLPGDVVRTIGERLLQAAVAVEVNGQVQDLMTPLRDGGTFRVLTARDARALDVLRHSTAHLLATAVRRVRPEAKIGFGPAIDDGFYYDFEVDHPFTPDDLERFEAEMARIAREKLPFVRAEVSRRDAQRVFADDPLKLERLSELGDGRGDLDLHRRPVRRSLPRAACARHVASQALQAAPHGGGLLARRRTPADAAAHLRHRLVQEGGPRRATCTASRRPSGATTGCSASSSTCSCSTRSAPARRSGRERGTTIFNALVGYVRELQREKFQEVRTPLLYNKGLWEISGHWGKYRENMFLVLDSETQEHDISLKPMNCPSHYLLYLARKHSYRELPLRLATFDVLHRNEVTGALRGSRACASSTRTTATSSSPRTRSPTRCGSWPI